METLEELTSVKNIVESSRYKDKISFLLENPGLARKTLKVLGGYYNQKPNCFGTIIFLLNEQRRFIENYEHTKDNEVIIIGGPGKEEGFCIFSEEERPGYIGSLFMKWFLQNCCKKIPEKERDCIIAAIPTDYINHGLLHTSLYLGNINNKLWIFEQEGEGLSFRFTAFRNYNNVKEIVYYLPCLA